MKEQAIAKIKAEMEKDKNAYVQAIGEMLLKHISAHPADAEKLLPEPDMYEKYTGAVDKLICAMTAKVGRQNIWVADVLL